MASLQINLRDRFQHRALGLVQVWDRTLSVAGTLLTIMEIPLSHLQDGGPAAVDIRRGAMAEPLERNFIEIER